MAAPFTEDELATFAYLPQRPAPSLASTQPFFDIPAPTPTTSIFSRSGSRSGNSQYLSQLDKYQELRRSQEAAMQASTLAQQMAGVDPFADDYPMRRFAALQQNPLALADPQGKARINVYDEAFTQGSALKKAREEQMMKAQEGSFLTALMNAENEDELLALAQANPMAAAKYNTIVQGRARKFAPSSRDPDRDAMYWQDQEQQALALLRDPMAMNDKDTVELAKRQIALARSKYAGAVPEAAAPAAPSAQWVEKTLPNGTKVRVLKQ